MSKTKLRNLLSKMIGEIQYHELGLTNYKEADPQTKETIDKYISKLS